MDRIARLGMLHHGLAHCCDHDSPENIFSIFGPSLRSPITLYAPYEV